MRTVKRPQWKNDAVKVTRVPGRQEEARVFLKINSDKSERREKGAGNPVPNAGCCPLFFIEPLSVMRIVSP